MMTVFKQLLNDYKQCLLRGDHSDGAAAYLAIVAEHEQAARRTSGVSWMRVIDEAMVVAHLGVADMSDDYATAKEKLNRLICWEIDVSKYFDAAAAPQPPEAALVPSIAVTPEMVEAANEAYCPFGDMELALCAALQVAPIPPGAAPVQLPEPVAKVEDGGLKWHIPDSGYSLPVRYLQGTHELYTEQKVRQMLSNHGIKENK